MKKIIFQQAASRFIKSIRGASIFIVLLTLANGSGAQTKTAAKDPQGAFDEANEIFMQIYENKNQTLAFISTKNGYSAVLPTLLDLYKQDPTNMSLAFKIGVCYLGSRKDRLTAIPYFEKAVTATTNDYKATSFKEKKAPLIAYKFLGDAYHFHYQFDKAIVAYQGYLKVMADNRNNDKMLLSDANRKIDMCNAGKRLMANPVKVKIQNLGNTVNSSYPDYSLILSADQNTIFFTSRRPETTDGEKDDNGNYMEDIYTSTKTAAGWSKAVNIGPPVNTKEHDAAVGVSPDAQTILIYKDDAGDGNIYRTTLNGDKWAVPVKLNEHVNSKYWEPSAAISADGSIIYFSSNRPGGYGGTDIYMSKLTSEGDWGEAINLGASINTPYDEDAPFIHPDGISLSFASNGHSTMGGLDIFTSILSSDGNWSAPVNVGYPINTTDDDIFYVVSPDGRKAYFSSFREDGLGEKDNYVATFTDRKETALTLVQGSVKYESGKPVKDVSITVTDNGSENRIGVYPVNNKTGQFLFILTPGKNYNITYESPDHLFYSENIDIPKNSAYYELNKVISLNSLVIGSRITLNNIFFDFDKATLRPLSNVELKNLLRLMKSNPRMRVEISAYTDNKGDDAYNLKLSEERAQAVVNQLTQKGISADRMKAKGYGEAMPAAPNQKPNGGDNPEGRQLNRRVELKIIGID